jgi:4-amino-4-deoxy-L-arabinose transferase-like glycosyltransferase
LLATALAFGLALRWYFYRYWPAVMGDTLVYGDIAKNLLLHGIYGFTRADGIHPTLIRLPGYPLFLALCFRVFGVQNYGPILWIQIVADLGSCLLISAFVRRVSSPRAATIALFVAALCPFTASYTAAPLTETLSIFCVALAMYAFARELEAPGIWPFLLLTFSFSYAALLRPDGALVAVAFCPALIIYVNRTIGFKRAFRTAFLAGLIAVLPFGAWAIRNWKTFHVIQPLAPRYATDPGEFTAPGFQRWTKTWCVDFASTQEIYWNEDGDKISLTDLPSRAFDSPEQRQQTADLLNDYNENTTVTPELDERFAAIADDRVGANPLRYYLVLPLARVADMWFRPRVEALPIDERWWKYRENPPLVIFCYAYAALNLALVLAAIAGLFFKPRCGGVLLAYMLLRSTLLATIEAPETRYTLECFPMIIALASVALDRVGRRQSTSAASP